MDKGGEIIAWANVKYKPYLNEFSITPLSI
jgi:hypothetical protein